MHHLNPDGLHKSPAYSQAVVVTGNTKTAYVGGQNAVDGSGIIVGKGDIKLRPNRFSGITRSPWRRPNPPTITVLFVATLANPDFLAEIDATFVVPAE